MAGAPRRHPARVCCKSRRHAAMRIAGHGWAAWLCKSPAIYLRCASCDGHIACFVANAFAFHTRKVVACRSRARRPSSRLARLPSGRCDGRRVTSRDRAGGARGRRGARRNASRRRPAIRPRRRRVPRAEAEGAVQQWHSLEARASPDGHGAARSGGEGPPVIWAAARAARCGPAGDRDRVRVPDAAGTRGPPTGAGPPDRAAHRSWRPASRPWTGCALWPSPPSSCYAVW
jgi:hypothetical protein